jgi:hypothetical protein
MLPSNTRRASAVSVEVLVEPEGTLAAGAHARIHGRASAMRREESGMGDILLLEGGTRKEE